MEAEEGGQGEGEEAGWRGTAGVNSDGGLRPTCLEGDLGTPVLGSQDTPPKPQQ